MPLEVETKLRIPDARTMERLLTDPEILSKQIDDMRRTAMEAYYFDTPKDALNERQWTLRLRKERPLQPSGAPGTASPDGFIGAFKAMASSEDALFTREEFSCHANTPDEAAERLAAQGAPAVLREMRPFVERCRIEFVRTSCYLRLAEENLPSAASVCEFALDEGVIYAEDKSEPLLELELELLSGPPDAMVALARRLEDRYTLQKEHNSKSGRALRLLRSRSATL